MKYLIVLPICILYCMPYVQAGHKNTMLQICLRSKMVISINNKLGWWA